MKRLGDKRCFLRFAFKPTTITTGQRDSERTILFRFYYGVESYTVPTMRPEDTNNLGIRPGMNMTGAGTPIRAVRTDYARIRGLLSWKTVGNSPKPVGEVITLRKYLSSLLRRLFSKKIDKSQDYLTYIVNGKEVSARDYFDGIDDRREYHIKNKIVTKAEYEAHTASK